MLQEKFDSILAGLGKWSCVGKKQTGQGNFTRCSGIPPHSCRFIFMPAIRYITHRLLPQFPTAEQQRWRNYSNEKGEGYFKRYTVPRGKGPK
mgnify:FL=1